MNRDPISEGPYDIDIGITEIDLQHRQLNSLLESLKNSTDKRYGYATNAILGELAIQTRIHFAVEESLMRLLAYPEVDAHVTEHRNLSERLEKFKRYAQDFDVEEGISAFIQTWLVEHINRFDRKFVAHFVSRGVDPLAAPEGG